MTGDADYQGRAVPEVATEQGVAWALLKPVEVSLLREAVRSQCEASARVAITGSSTDRPIPEATGEERAPSILAE